MHKFITNASTSTNGVPCTDGVPTSLEDPLVDPIQVIWTNETGEYGKILEQPLTHVKLS